MPAEKVTINTYSMDAQGTSLKESHDDSCGPRSGSGKHKGRYGGKGLIWSLILFIFLVLVVFIVLISWSPKWLRKNIGKKRDCDEDSSDSKKCVNYGKAIGWAVVVSIVLVILFWLLSGVTAGFLSVCRRS